MSDLTFVSSPYSSPNRRLVGKRVHEVSKYCAEQIEKGNNLFSPIAYGSMLLDHYELESNWTFWQGFCETMLLKSDKMTVLMLDGWENSEGVAGEIKFAKEHNIPIEYIKP